MNKFNNCYKLPRSEGERLAESTEMVLWAVNQLWNIAMYGGNVMRLQEAQGVLKYHYKILCSACDEAIVAAVGIEGKRDTQGSMFSNAMPTPEANGI